MKRLTLTAALAGMLFAPAQAQSPTHYSASAPPLPEYRMFPVAPTDSLEAIAKGHLVTVEAILQLNPELRGNGGVLAGKSYIFLPVAKPTFWSAKKAKAAETLATSAPAAASPAESKPAPAAVKPGSGNNLSDDEIEALYNQVVKPMAEHHHVSTAIQVAMAPLPESNNFFTTSDGRVLNIPMAKPHHKEEPKEAEPDMKTGITSVRGKQTEAILKSALSYLTVPYVWGGSEPSGFDCSGFVQWVYAHNGIRLPRTADLQYEVGQTIKPGTEQPGDLIYFETYCPGPSHIGIFLGHRQFVHASSSAGQVTISNLDSERFQKVYLGSKRPW